MKPVLAALFPSFFGNAKVYGADVFLASATFGGTKVKDSVHKSIMPNAFVLIDMGQICTEIRGHSPEDREEEIMTSHGIMKRIQVSL